MNKIKLKGKSSKGKNRIAQHGENWTVIKETDRLQCLPNLENPALIESHLSRNMRWISLTNDKDFEIL